MASRAFAALRRALGWWKLPEAAKAALRKDRAGLPTRDPGIETSTAAAIQWLLLAQLQSASRDGGVACHYNLLEGWGPSYPETTGYIVPTFIDWGLARRDQTVLDAARLMSDWLVSIQFEHGGFQGGVVGADTLVPVTFNTGQILIGLAAAAREWGEPYRTAMNRAATWLADTQDNDGCWRRYPTPFAAPGEKAYETHVAWGLIEAAKIEPGRGYEEKALANLRWALGQQRDNGWVENCCLDNGSVPLTHTLGYFLRGLIETYLYREDPLVLVSAVKLARSLAEVADEHGFLPGRLDECFRGTVPWSCLTGSLQIAHCLLLLYRETGDCHYRDTGFALNRYVRRSVQVTGQEEIVGGVKGSFPIGGGYGYLKLLSWAVKFFIDSNLLEAEVRKHMTHGVTIHDAP